MVDLTTLEGKDSPEKVRALCLKADHALRGTVIDPPAAAGGRDLRLSRTLVRGRRRKTLTGSDVQGRLGRHGIPQRPVSRSTCGSADVRKAAVEAGADEIDMVISRGAFLAGRYEPRSPRRFARSRQACGDAHLKIILETGELETYDNVRRASDLAIEAAASTGPLRPTARSSSRPRRARSAPPRRCPSRSPCSRRSAITTSPPASASA